MWLQQHNSHRHLTTSARQPQHHANRLITLPHKQNSIARRVHIRVFDNLRDLISKYTGSNSSKGSSSINAESEVEDGAEMVVPCTKSLLEATLEAALAAEYPQYEQPALGQRRALFMSGMYGSEVVELIAAYKDAGLPPCAFAAAVPKNYQRTVRDLTESVWRDHAAMMAKQQQQQMMGEGLNSN